MKLFKTIDEMTLLLGRVADDSPVYQRIALYIEKNYQRVIFMTANELADAMGVSQGSVSRFFIAIGYHGYNEFLRNLQQIVARDYITPQPREAASGLSIDDPRRELLEREIANITILGSLCQQPEYQQLVDMALQPKKLLLVSARLSATMLPYLEYVLKKIGIDVQAVTPDTPDWEWLEFMDPDRVNVMVVGFPSYPTVLIKKCQQLKRQGFFLFAVTDSQFSPLVKCTARSIFVPVILESPFDGCSTPVAFFSLLLRDIADRLPQFTERQERIKDMERKARPGPFSPVEAAGQVYRTYFYG